MLYLFSFEFTYLQAKDPRFTTTSLQQSSMTQVISILKFWTYTIIIASFHIQYLHI